MDIENDNEPNLGTRKELDNVFSLVDENNNFDIINLESNTNKESMEENSGLILENLLANFFKDDVRELNCEKCKTKNGQSKVCCLFIKY